MAGLPMGTRSCALALALTPPSPHDGLMDWPVGPRPFGMSSSLSRKVFLLKLEALMDVL